MYWGNKLAKYESTKPTETDNVQNGRTDRKDICRKNADKGATGVSMEFLIDEFRLLWARFFIERLSHLTSAFKGDDRRSSFSFILRTNKKEIRKVCELRKTWQDLNTNIYLILLYHKMMSVTCYTT